MSDTNPAHTADADCTLDANDIFLKAGWRRDGWNRPDRPSRLKLRLRKDAA